MEWTIVRLQVQRSPLKPGRAPNRWYDPTPLQSVASLELSDDGSIGVTDAGERVLDVHNRTHSQSRDPKGRGGFSVMGTGDYFALRSIYGPHLADGLAGESAIVDAPEGLAGSDFPEVMTIRTHDGPLQLHRFRVAEPCVEFTRFCLQLPPDSPVDQTLKDTLKALDSGARGYKGSATSAGTVRIGDSIAR